MINIYNMSTVFECVCVCVPVASMLNLLLRLTPAAVLILCHIASTTIQKMKKNRINSDVKKKVQTTHLYTPTPSKQPYK